MEPFSAAKVSDNPGEVDLCNSSDSSICAHDTKLTFERRVGLELLKLFIRYQIDFKMLALSISQLRS